MPTTVSATFDPRFEALIDQGRDLLAAERWEEALAAYRRAEEVAESLGDDRAADRAFANVCAMLLSIRRHDGVSAERTHRLREILIAGGDEVNCRLAAYNLARTYEFGKELRKGLFYARIALDRSKILTVPDWIASSHNQIGNLLLAESRFEEASAEYRQALLLLEDEVSARRALILTNLGYAEVVLGRLRPGIAHCYESLRSLMRQDAGREQIVPRLDLCFALLELGRLRHALRHGARALALAEEHGEHDTIKLALFLLGEILQQAGDSERARDYFSKLQARYFPESRDLPDILLTIDVRKLINLKA